MQNINPAMVVLAVIAIVAIAFAAWMYLQKERTQKLRSKFGPEYDRAIDEHGDRLHGESDLEKRAKRVEKFHIRRLEPAEQTRYAESWQREQALFVDNPRDAVNHADALVQEVMKQRGYPVSTFEQNAADLSVDHPRVVENYRLAHEIALRDGQSRANTEDLRRAMVSYRTLFEDLLEQSIHRPEEVRR
jgi:FtsZ-interacting cell division protein ZipA